MSAAFDPQYSEVMEGAYILEPVDEREWELWQEAELAGIDPELAAVHVDVDHSLGESLLELASDGDGMSALVSTRTWVIVPDLQVPYQDVEAVEGFIEWLQANRSRIHGTANVGDEVDNPQTGRWNRGLAEEYALTMRRDFAMTHEIMKRIVAAVGKSKPHHLARSNHGDRVSTYVRKTAGALTELTEPGRCLDQPVMLGYDRLGIQFHREPFELESGWVVCHGDEGGGSQIPGGVARGLANKWGKNVICGHTHKAGIIPGTTGFLGDFNTSYGMEVGCLMDMTQAGYLGPGVANWQLSFGLLHISEYADGSVVGTPSLRFIVDGRVEGGPLAAPVRKLAVAA